MKNGSNEILIGGAIVFKYGKKSKKLFLLSKNDKDEWEILKTIVRRGESSVRSVIRMTSEQGNMNARVLEEAGRATGAATVNGKLVDQKYYYYLMYYRTGAEVSGLGDTAWFDYATSLRKITLKREKDIFRNANSLIKVWEKTKKQMQQEEEDAKSLLEE